MSSSASANRGQLIQVAEGILCSWLQEEGYTETAYHRLLNLLDAELLLDLPLKPGLKKIRSPAGLRFLWHIHAAKALGWKSRRSKGSARGFPASINTFLRQEWWPDVQQVPQSPLGLAALQEPESNPSQEPELNPVLEIQVQTEIEVQTEVRRCRQGQCRIRIACRQKWLRWKCRQQCKDLQNNVGGVDCGLVVVTGT